MAPLPRRRGSWSKPRGTRATRWWGSQGPVHPGSRLSQVLFAHPSFPLLGLGPPGAGPAFGKSPPPGEAHADFLRSEEGALYRRKSWEGRTWGTYSR